MSAMYRIRLAGGPRDGESYDTMLPIEAGEVFLSRDGSIIEGNGGRYVALEEPELGPDGKLETVAYWEPERQRSRLEPGSIAAAAFAGLLVGLSAGISFAVIGWVTGLLAGLLGGWLDLILYATLAGPIVAIGWVLFDPTITERPTK